MPRKQSRPEPTGPARPNPLGGWRGVGASMLNDRLWPCDFDHSPLAAYLAFRRRLLDDLLALFPWAAIVLVAAAFLFLCIDTNNIRLFFFGVPLAWLFLPTIFFAFGVMLGRMNLHRLMRVFPFEELSLTLTPPIEIVHALAIRPLVGTGLGALVAVVGLLAMAWPAALWPLSRLDPIFAVQYALIVVAGVWTAGAAAEVGVAYALRAHLFIPSPRLALWRCCRDWLTSRLLVLPLLGFLAVVFMQMLIFSPLGTFGPFVWTFHLLSLIALAVMVRTVGEAVDFDGREAVDDLATYADLWWMRWTPPAGAPPVPWLRLGWEDLLRLLSDMARHNGEQAPAAPLAPASPTPDAPQAIIARLLRRKRADPH